MVCHSTPEEILKDESFEPVHMLTESQEYIGNFGKKIKKRKDHDTYFNWEVGKNGVASKKRLFGRIYNSYYSQKLTGTFDLCKKEDEFFMLFGNKNKKLIPVKVFQKVGKKNNKKYTIVQIKYLAFSVTFFDYPLKKHGTLKSKFKSSSFGKVAMPTLWEEEKDALEVANTEAIALQPRKPASAIQ